MNIAQTQLDISNKSYTNKDFASIYTELLGYAEKITTRFSPVNANETDPFIVLLKLAAFIADKINYNVDKNILERFMASCTQETSMQELTAMMGYRMHFYKTAITDVTFSYLGDLDTVLGHTWTGNLQIPRFTTIVTGSNVQYVTLAPAEISRITNKSTSIAAAQGKLKRLSVLDNDIIQLENLDANNRVYFPEYQVAENGVFVSNVIDSGSSNVEWEFVENLNEQPYLSLVYYFGYDSSRNLPYLEFPSWISEIIRDGLAINYLVTDGVLGNIAPNSFKSIDFEFKWGDGETANTISSEAISVINYSAANNGADPESINASYKGFKRLVGTLDTLVTCRDYAARIYELLDIYGNSLVSNVIVSDRRTDINNSITISTVDELGAQLITQSIKNEESDVLSPYDICTYAYRPLTSTAYSSKDLAGGYEDSYRLLPQSSLNEIQNILEDEKSLSHNYKQFDPGDIVAIRIYQKLNAIVNTTSKVSALEGATIIENIKNALIKNYNPRVLDFGKSITYEDLLAVMEGSDIRIKSIVLQEPEQTPKIVKLNGTGNLEEIPVLVDASDDKPLGVSDEFKFLLMKNIISGRVLAFDYDESFEYEYIYKDCVQYTEKMFLDSFANIKLAPENGMYSYTLNSNEVIQLIAPKFDTFVTYPYGVLYKLHLVGPADKKISRNADYQLAAGEYLILAYADSSNAWHFVKYAGSPSGVVEIVDGITTSSVTNPIISPSFDMFDTLLRQSTPTKVFDSRSLPPNLTAELEYAGNYFQISSNEEIQAKKELSEKLDSECNIYWKMNNSANAINWQEVADPSLADGYRRWVYTLSEGEYFYYSDVQCTYYKEFASGTTLTLVAKSDNIHNPGGGGGVANYWILGEDRTINISDVVENGLAALSNYFKYFDKISSASHEYLTITLNEIHTFTEHDKIFIKSNLTSDLINISNNDFELLDSDNLGTVEFSYCYNFEQNQNTRVIETLSDRSSLLPDYRWKIRGLLDINCSPTLMQQLNGENRIVIRDESGVEIEFKDICIKADINLALAGGENIDLRYQTLDQILVSSSDYTYPKFIAFDIDELANNALSKIANDLYVLIPDLVDENAEIKQYTYPNIFIPKFQDKYVAITAILPSNIDSDKAVIKLSIEKLVGELITATTSSDVDFYLNGAPVSGKVELVPGVNNILLKNKTSTSNLSLKFENVATESQDSIGIQLSKIKIISGINPELGLAADVMTSLTPPALVESILAYSEKIPNIKSCAFFAPIDTIKMLELTPDFPLTSAEAFYDVNNVANAWVMPKIDFTNSIIRLSKNSIKQ